MTTPTPPQRPVGPYEQRLRDSRAARRAREHKMAARRRRRVISSELGIALLVSTAVGGAIWWTGSDVRPPSQHAPR